MRVVGWNVQQGGGTRAARLVAALVTLNADVLVLSEHRASGPLASMLMAHGWTHQIGIPDPSGGYAAVLVASRSALLTLAPQHPDETCSSRWVHVQVADSGWAVAGALIPGHHRDHPLRKERFWDFVVSDFAPLAALRPTLFVGDLNTGLHGIDEIGATLRCSAHMISLRSAGWVDVWHAMNPSVRPPSTWWEPTTGNGFRLDHAFLSPCSPPAIAIDYPRSVDNTPTTRAGARKAAGEVSPLSDHVPVVVDLPPLSGPLA
ncbi:hypothetical protein CIW49_13555 [Mycolicibacterium sp. P1-18]|uniref:endonuclease/exonuclease/phosphatase family protein n=1 Tax=Mycolicibacterium sp. P1-18 TaxID=2024615 RepID=UPI001251D054|nr:hypothetical protein CIW49_13555 [Mycolicibacterium sp. P1-18]